MSRRLTPRGSTRKERLSLLSEVDPETGCWIWQASTYGDGYPRMVLAKGLGRGAHRVSYELYKGSIPEGMQVDHLCFRPLCVNPDHLRLLTLLENARNLRRAYKTHCVHGHEFTPDNTKYQVNRRNPAGPKHRSCRECERVRNRQRRAARAAA